MVVLGVGAVSYGRGTPSRPKSTSPLVSAMPACPVRLPETTDTVSSQHETRRAYATTPDQGFPLFLKFTKVPLLL